MAEPPVEPGAVNATLACAAPAVAVPMVGAPGTVTVEDPVVVMLYFCSRVVTVDAVIAGQAPAVAAERWIKPA